MDMSQYMDMFMEEAREHLQTLNAKMLELEENPGQLSILDEIFRSAHTLKGMSATMGFERVAELTHDMENVLSNLRSGQVPVTTEIVDVLFRCLDALENMVDTIGTGQEDDVQLEDLIQSLRLAGRGELGTGTAAPASSKQKHEEATVIENQTSASNKQIIEDLLGSFAF